MFFSAKKLAILSGLACICLGVSLALASTRVDEQRHFAFGRVQTLQLGDRFTYRVRIPRAGFRGGPSAPAARAEPVPQEAADYTSHRFLAEVAEVAEDSGAVHAVVRITESPDEGGDRELMRTRNPGDEVPHFSLALTRQDTVTQPRPDGTWPWGADVTYSSRGIEHPLAGYPPFGAVETDGVQTAALTRGSNVIVWKASSTEGGARVEAQYYRTVQWNRRSHYGKVLYFDERTGQVLEESPRPERPSLAESGAPDPRDRPAGDVADRQRWEPIAVASYTAKRPPEDVIAVVPAATEEQTWEAGMPLPSKLVRYDRSGYMRMELTLIERPERYGPIESEE